MTTNTAEILLSSQGIITVRIKSGARQSLDDAKANLSEAIAAGSGVKRPLMTDIRFCEPLAPEARRYYSGSALVESFLAMGILIDSSPFGKTMGNIYLSIAKPGIPTKLFTDEPSAINWLVKQLK